MTIAELILILLLLPAVLFAGVIRNVTDTVGLTTKVKQEAKLQEPGPMARIERELDNNFFEFFSAKDPSKLQERRGLWDPCSLDKMPTCKD